MSRRASRRKTHAEPAGRPSTFFIAAIAVALAILGWLYVQSLRNPEKPAPPKPPATATATTPVEP